ncbi:hypothetical protein MAC_06187 [Metarhizium acridum CQMa 102]|uniref:Heat-labile enterotoxin IIA, A chain n=1 Tax=Metarhizium acridum (strain CQMa 102) TaxID=655827 RepID=E9E8I9_METAQ|nr:uncharacterized protein MAC_06187 [Metarhizium acridum CQMa 102]EFY87820.1 hypothetical protein MAC_06187 [Metarhizium acridum CQMa 102]
MKVSVTCFALLGLGCAHLTLVDRAPQGPYKETPPGKQITEAIKNGIKDWGPAGSLKPPEGGPKAPIKNMPGGLPELRRPKPGSSDWRDDTLKGPRKKPGTTYPKGSPCLKRDGPCLPGSSRSKGTKVAKFSRFRVPKSVGRATAFMVVAPYAHDLLDRLKQWDNPVGHAVRWFDDAMASLQEAIGGPQRDDIYGNELKYKIVKGIGGALQPWETTYEMHERLNMEAAAKEKARQRAEEEEKERIRGLEELSETCEKLNTERPEDDALAAQLEKSCGKLAAELKKIEDKEAARAKKKVKKDPIIVFGKCRASLNHIVI